MVEGGEVAWSRRATPMLFFLGLVWDLLLHKREEKNIIVTRKLAGLRGIQFRRKRLPWLGEHFSVPVWFEM